ncbi:uroporphyrinogen-III C-methyltransferase [Vibrio sp. TRT 17S01]|uniref:uroporphyrinogen-III C-methyltransferase n=1 Tax=Vibrio sp. TRT 17S01 TaxID=3418505 RepID=UPI003CF7EBC7
MKKCNPSYGRVYLVGAGTGDASLLTLKAFRLLNHVDVVLYDHLVSEEILDCIPRKTRKIFVGKRYGKCSNTQTEINERIKDYALTGMTVCRLKAGDPFIFGRGGEEAIYLRQYGINYEVVPGITAALGCCAYAGIPTTHRLISRGVTLITGHHCNDGSEPNWSALAAINHTMIFYMGIHKTKSIADNLIAHGVTPDKPCAIISNGTRENQSTIITTLAGLYEICKTQNPALPAIIVVGDVVSLSESLEWFKPAAKFYCAHKVH